MLARESFCYASLTIAWIISEERGGFLCTGLASDLLMSSNIFLTGWWAVGDSMPASEWDHISPFFAFSAKALEDFALSRYCRYNVTSRGLAGNTESWFFVAHTFHFLKAPIYFLVVEGALPCKTIADRAAARFCNSGSCKSFKDVHSPVSSTSKKNKRITYDSNEGLTKKSTQHSGW